MTAQSIVSKLLEAPDPDDEYDPADIVRNYAGPQDKCRHCGRAIVQENGIWIDPEATGDDAVWRESCDSNDTFQALHEPTGGPWFDERGNLLREIPKEAAEDCSHSGDCGADVESWVRELNFEVPRDLAIKWLRDFGAWDDEELAATSDSDLAERVFWLACGDINEQGEWFGLMR